MTPERRRNVAWGQGEGSRDCTSDQMTQSTPTVGVKGVPESALMGFASDFDTYEMCGLRQIFLTSPNPQKLIHNNSSLRGVSQGSKERTV